MTARRGDVPSGVVPSAPPRGDLRAAFDTVGADVAGASTAWRAEIAHGRRIEAAAGSLEVTGDGVGRSSCPAWRPAAS